MRLYQVEKTKDAKKLREWSLEVRKGGHCEICGSQKYLNAHHILDRKLYPQFKLELMNGVVLCPTHHKFGRHSAHRNPVFFSEWLKEYMPLTFAWVKERIGYVEREMPSLQQEGYYQVYTG